MKTDPIKSTAAINDALNIPTPTQGWTRVVWANRIAPDSPISYGFNFQRLGSVRLGAIINGAYCGSRDHAQGSICKAIAILD